MVLNLLATFAILLPLAVIAITVLKRRSPAHVAHRFGPEHGRLRGRRHGR